jgi:CRISPR-associated protein Cas1
MQTHANTLYVQTQGAYLSKNHETVQVKVDGDVKLTVPLHHLEAIVCFGRVSISPALMEVVHARQLPIGFLSEHGRFLARVVPATSGNVLLRREQYRRADQPEACLRVARSIVAAKIQNCRMLLLRAAREAGGNALRRSPPSDADAPRGAPNQNMKHHGDDAPRGMEADRADTDRHAGGSLQPGGVEDPACARARSGKADSLRHAADRLASSLLTLSQASTIDSVRGCEGDAARCYYEAFNCMIRQQGESFQMTGRTRRPPMDPLNALLSFLYSLLTHDVASALEAVGLDPAVGFLHTDRPGRLSLALDLVEEFRPLLADRLALALINLRQVSGAGFETQPGGAVLMDAATRKTVLAALTQRKRETIEHPLLGEQTTIGLLPHIQARLLARHIRGDIEDYPALVLK